VHRGIGCAHLLQGLFGGNAPIHHPHPPRLAVLLLDTLEEARQRGVVGGIARQHLVGQRQALGGDHQRDDHLHAVAALVARVAEAAFVLVLERRIGLEVGAGQVIENSDILPVGTTTRCSGQSTRAFIPLSSSIRFTRCMVRL